MLFVTQELFLNLPKYRNNGLERISLVTLVNSLIHGGGEKNRSNETEV